MNSLCKASKKAATSVATLHKVILLFNSMKAQKPTKSQTFRIKKAIAAYQAEYKDFLSRYDRKYKRTMLAFLNYVIYCAYKTALRPRKQCKEKFYNLIKSNVERYCYASTSGCSTYILNEWRAEDEFLWKRGNIYHSAPILNKIAVAFRDELGILSWDERFLGDGKREPRRYHLSIGQCLLLAECIEEDLLDEHYSRVGERGNIREAIAPHCCYTLVIAFDFVFGAIGRFWRRLDEDVLQPMFAWDVTQEDFIEFWNFIV